ncbi:RNA 2'-phosphotransferase, partial [Aquimarina addita]|uniref:RNA 2'-phosphotransferase n=1 Tax=Aquimarina addita TaxID=870485 RepID=UPI0031F020C9
VEDLQHMVNQSEKKRHELEGEYIRAIYGHSVDGKFRKDNQKPPEILYHGTSRETAPIILEEGIKSMDRQYVHLSQVVKEAMRVGKRKDSEPVILQVDAEKAFHEGVKFYEGNDRIWLSDYIPSSFLSIYNL